MSSYKNRFGNNIGVVTAEEQERLKNAHVAVAGAGGVGGNALHTLARAGVGTFSIADFDHFSTSNTNRQYGADNRTIDVPKIDVVERELKAINPEVVIKKYPQGLTMDNIDDFLEGADAVVDAIDFLAPAIRKKLIDTIQQKGIYSFLAPALGFGASLSVFGPDTLSHDAYFGPLPDPMTAEYALSVAGKLFPNIPEYIDMAAYSKGMDSSHHLPTFAPPVILAGTLAANDIIMLIIGKKRPVCIPHVKWIDLYEQKLEILKVEGSFGNEK